MLGRDCRHIATLIVADLRYEWILSVCMVLALSAVFAPLFILLGLQEGIIGNMLDRLKKDPSSCLVTPKFPLHTPLDKVWLQSLEKQSQVVIASSTSHLLLNIEGLDDPVNAVPTDTNDPLLLNNGVTLPDAGRHIVLSQRLAQLTGKSPGDTLVVTLIRMTGKEEKVPITFQIAGILPKSAAEDVRMWLPKNLFQGFYRWRQGHEVPEMKLSGGSTNLSPEFDGFLTLLRRVPTDEEYRRMLARRIGFSQPPEPLSNPGWKIPPHFQIRLWRPINNRVFEGDKLPLANRHNELGYEVEVVPFLSDFQVTLTAADSCQKLSLTVLPPLLEKLPPTAPPNKAPRVWIARQKGFRKPVAGKISFLSGFPGGQGQEIVLPVEVYPSSIVTPGYLAVPERLAGEMNAARRQVSVYSPTTGSLSATGDGPRFFRAYARSIDELEELVEFIRREGEQRGLIALREPISRVAEVRNIRRLAGYMEKLYLLIVVVSGVAGFFAITASVYAGVQRQRHDLAYLQLLGIHPAALFFFPCLKSLTLVAGGLVTALIAYTIFGQLSTNLLPLGGASLTRLTAPDILILVTGILAAASVASLLAATAVTRIDPGEYIRE